MAQTPDEKTYVEIPFIEQLKGMDWDHIEGDIDVPYPCRRAILRQTQTPEKRPHARLVNRQSQGERALKWTLPWND